MPSPLRMSWQLTSFHPWRMLEWNEWMTEQIDSSDVVTLAQLLSRQCFLWGHSGSAYEDGLEDELWIAISVKFTGDFNCKGQAGLRWNFVVYWKLQREVGFLACLVRTSTRLNVCVPERFVCYNPPIPQGDDGIKKRWGPLGDDLVLRVEPSCMILVPL